MKISIITATYNSQKTISQNISSVLDQSFKNFEQIIVDNNSDDNTVLIAKQFYQLHGVSDKLKIIKEKDQGIADAFNKGIQAAQGEIIAILNSDDELYDHTVFADVHKIFSDSKALFVHGDIFFADAFYGSNIRKPLESNVIGLVFNHPAMFIRKEVYDKVGCYDTTFRYSMDFELYCRLKKTYHDTKNISAYIAKPIVTMNAGGASWHYEIDSINEIKRAMKLHGFWNVDGVVYFLGRYFRVWIKRYVTMFGLSNLIKFWRKRKWKG
ncbi:MAG: glycosyltransferase family 2 protein [Bacteroidota bacterium]|nr:glycosyltransferase family 2 protein [Bacteroidota bacterium]